MKKVKLVDICKIQYGFAFDSSLFSNSNNGMPLIRIRDVVRGFTDTYTSEAFIEDYVVNKGDLLIGMDGEFNIAEWQSEKALLNQRVCKLIPSSTVGKRYIYYSLIKILKQIEEKTAFVTVKHLSAKELNKVEIPLPSLEEQKAIAGKLDKVSGLIEKRKTQLEKLDLLIKSRFIEMFGGKYKTGKLGDVVKTTSGGTPSKAHPEYYENGNIPWLTSGEVNAGVITSVKNHITDLGMKNSSAKMVPANSVVIAMYGATAGVTGLIRLDTTTNQAVCSILPSERFVPEYLYYAVSSKKDWMISQCQGGGQPNISQGIIKNMDVIDAPIEEQIRFAAFVEETDKSKFEIQKSLEKLDILKKSLMQQYFG